MLIKQHVVLLDAEKFPFSGKILVLKGKFRELIGLEFKKIKINFHKSVTHQIRMKLTDLFLFLVDYGSEFILISIGKT